jgi:hypothetical protein
VSSDVSDNGGNETEDEDPDAIPICNPGHIERNEEAQPVRNAGSPPDPDVDISNLLALFEEQQPGEDDEKSPALIAEAPPAGLPPPPSAPALAFENVPGFTRAQHEHTIPRWGGLFRLTHRKMSSTYPHGAWQAVCFYHRKNATTLCTKTLAVQSETAEARWETLRLAKLWCVQAPNYTYKRDHGQWNPRSHPLIAMDILDVQVLEMIPPPLIVVTDEQLDMADANQAQGHEAEHMSPDEAGPDSSDGGDEAGPSSSSSESSTSGSPGSSGDNGPAERDLRDSSGSKNSSDSNASSSSSDSSD